MKVVLPDNAELELPNGATGLDAARAIGPKLAEQAVLVRTDGRVQDVRLPLADGARVQFLTTRDTKDPDALYVLRHSSAHLLAEAVRHLYPGVKIAIGPPIENGFYYDFEFPEPIREEDLEKIQAEIDGEPRKAASGRVTKDVGSKYTIDDAVADMQRAIRTVKSRAAEWGVDPDRVGVIGFSAGGALSGMASARFNDPVKNPVDDIDKLSAKPTFEALIYGTPFTTLLGQPATPVTRDLPPTFMACGGSDPISETYPDIYKTLKAAGVPVELHIYGGVSHGFGIQEFTPLNVSTWPDRLRDWMAVSGSSRSARS